MAFVSLRASAGHNWAARTSSCQGRRTKREGVARLRNACVWAVALLRNSHKWQSGPLPGDLIESSAETLGLGGAPAPLAAPPP